MLWELRRPWPVAEFRSLCIVAGSRLRQVQGGAGWQGRQLAVHELVACVRRIATFARIARRQLASAQPQLEHKWPQAFRHVGPIRHQDFRGNFCRTSLVRFVNTICLDYYFLPRLIWRTHEFVNTVRQHNLFSGREAWTSGREAWTSGREARASGREAWTTTFCQGYFGAHTTLSIQFVNTICLVRQRGLDLRKRGPDLRKRGLDYYFLPRLL